MQGDVVVLDASAAHVARLREPGLSYEQEGVAHTVRLGCWSRVS